MEERTAIGPDGELWPVISSYTQAQAIEDGVLVRAPAQLAHEAGWKCDVLLTSALHALLEDIPPRACGQDYNGRIWDMLWMGHRALHGAARGGHLRAACPELFFRWILTMRRGHNLRTKLVLTATDEGLPCAVFMLDTED